MRKILYFTYILFLLLGLTPAVVGAWSSGDHEITTTYTFVDNTYKKIKDGDGTIYTYVGEGCNLDWDGKVQKCNFSSWVYKGVFTGNDRYYIGTTLTNGKPDGQDASIHHLWKTLWGMGWVKHEEYPIKINLPASAKPKTPSPAPNQPPQSTSSSSGASKQAATSQTTAAKKSTNPSAKTPSFKSMFGDYLSGACKNKSGQVGSYECWIQGVWNWSMLIIIPLATIVLIAAGIIYMTSGGNPDRVSLAKKMIFGALSGLALLVLGKVFLVNILGITSSWNV